ncbi:protein kinase domain containing protein [Stylonychia lemnae]|uniref:Casein kinase I n=1 Tax=Stylonychia lemnae TaxID=5949 RepID=A0A077ZYJ6_STYLE|nr:protein kinase domain containing protein [Stylonychia lemnae]|eukprot:CDW74955.1 protein kinase domain containing protein [Stylonychia lemnae]
MSLSSGKSWDRTCKYYNSVHYPNYQLQRIETLHDNGIVHRDLKPKNIMINHSVNEIVLIDFGLSNKYMSQYQTHIPNKSTKKILGTPLYASNNALLGKGTLPWKGLLNLDFLKSETAKYKIYAWRDPEGELCQNIDPEFKEILEYAQKLEFDEEPDYEYIESLLISIKERNNFDDYVKWDNVHLISNDATKINIIVNQISAKIDHNTQTQDIISANLTAKELQHTFKDQLSNGHKKKIRHVKRLKKGVSQTSKIEFNESGTKMLPKSKKSNTRKKQKHSQKQILQAINNEVEINANSNNYQQNEIDYNPKGSVFSNEKFQSDDPKLNQSNQSLDENSIEDIPSENAEYDQFINDVNKNCMNLEVEIKEKYWDQESLEEGALRIKDVPDFNCKRNKLSRKSQIYLSIDKSPLRLNKLKSCTNIEKIKASSNRIKEAAPDI